MTRPEWQPKPSITCPRCGMRSYHPTDVQTGYCGICHAFTSVVRAKRFLRESDPARDD